MNIEETFLHYADILFREGFLHRPEDLVCREKGEIFGLKKETNLKALKPEDIFTTSLENWMDDTAIVRMFGRVFSADEKAGAVLLSLGSYTLAAAVAGRKVPPLLDDLAQLIGPGLKVSEPGKAAGSLGKRNAVLIRNLGGLCKAGNLYDLHAVAMVMEKGCQAEVNSWYLGGGRRISYPEALLMRLIYLKKYSREVKRT